MWPWQFIRRKIQLVRALSAEFDAWDIQYRGTCNPHFHYCLAVKRCHIWSYWRPINVSFFEQQTLHYRGPYIPIFASRSREWRDHEPYDRKRFTRRPRYQTVAFYFVVPEFVLQPEWGHERSWRWSPAVKINGAMLRTVLWNELEHGGWKRNHRGNPQIPKITGCSGLIQRPGEGWAGFRESLE
jgi:hypothetical protein